MLIYLRILGYITIINKQELYMHISGIFKVWNICFRIWRKLEVSVFMNKQSLHAYTLCCQYKVECFHGIYRLFVTICVMYGQKKHFFHIFFTILSFLKFRWICFGISWKLKRTNEALLFNEDNVILLFLMYLMWCIFRGDTLFDSVLLLVPFF